MSFFLSLLLISIISLTNTESLQKLVFVMTHFRHGARAPQNFYDGDNYLDYVKEHWENPGELTGIGQRMHYLLGIRNRIRYITNETFLSNKFDPHEILIYSSPFNRTIISVSSQLQGLYPQFIKEGEKLTKDEEKMSLPQVDVNCSIINEEISNLNLNALPNSMILAPVRMINNNERKITLYDIEGCTDERDAIKTKHSESLDTLLNITDFFNQRYGEKLNNFYGEKKEKYDMWFMDNFCDAFISGYTHKRNMTELKNAGFDFDDLINFCFEFQTLNFRDWISGDEKHVLAHLEVSKLMREFIHYMKERINADIKKENIGNKFEDYSRPKMMMISGHDSTLSCFEMFLMEALGYDKSFYIYPKFAAQIAFEITTKDDDRDGKTFNDYFINYYFNDELKFNITVQEFINKITPHIWTDKQINDFCGFDDNNKDDDEKGGNNDENKEIIYVENDSYKIAFIIFICLTVILILIVLILLLKIHKLTKLKSNANTNTLLLSISEQN